MQGLSPVGFLCCMCQMKIHKDFSLGGTEKHATFWRNLASLLWLWPPHKRAMHYRYGTAKMSAWVLEILKLNSVAGFQKLSAALKMKFPVYFAYVN